jgi:BED zinc finger
MPTEKKTDQIKCMFCMKEIALFSGTTTTWIHLDTNKSESGAPFPHTAKPWIMKQG